MLATKTQIQVEDDYRGIGRIATLPEFGTGRYDFLTEFVNQETGDRTLAVVWVNNPCLAALNKAIPAGCYVSDWKLVVVPF